MLHDVCAAIRGLWKTPSFTLVALAVLALGIGTTAAVFAVVDGVVLRGLPFGDASFRTRTSMGEPVEVLAQSVTWEFFPVLRITPALGRAFVPDDETVGRHHVVVLGHAYWRQRSRLLLQRHRTAEAGCRRTTCVSCAYRCCAVAI